MIVMRKSEFKYDVKNKRKSGNVLWLIGLESRSSLRDLSVLASPTL